MAERGRYDPTRQRVWPDEPAESRGVLGFVRRYRHGTALAIYSGLTVVTLLTAYGLRFDLALPDEYVEALPLHIAALVTLRLVVAWAAGLTRVAWRYIGAGDLVRLGLTALLPAAAYSVAFRVSPLLPNVPWSVVMVETALFLLAVGVAWLTYRHFHELSRIRRKPPVERRRAPRRVVIVGAGEQGNALARQLQRQPRDFEVIGFLDDSRELKGVRLQGLPVLGGVDDAPRVLPDLDVNEVAVAVHSPSPRFLRRVVDALRDSRVPVKVIAGDGPSLDGADTSAALRRIEIEDLLGRDPVSLALPQLTRDLAGATVLVTGAAGSIGSELARQIAANHPARLVLLDQAESPLYWIDLELRGRYPGLAIDAVVADILDAERMDAVFEDCRPQRVYHAAAYKHVPLMEANPREALRNNVLGTWEVARRAGKHGVGRFVLISTDKAADPINVMGATKRAAEMAVQELQERFEGTHYTAVRFGNVLGSAGSVIPLFKKQVESGGPITITHPDVTRYFMTIPEAVQLVLQAGLLPEARGRIAMLEMGEPVRIIDLARNLVQLAGLRPEVDIPFAIVGLRPGEKLHETLQGADEAPAPTSLPNVHLLAAGRPKDTRMAALAELVRGGVADADARSILTSIAALDAGEAAPSLDALEEAAR